MGKVDSTSIWLERTFDETLSLLEEAKHYHADRFPKQVRHETPYKRLEMTQESLRVTSRLSHMISWLLHEKAILNKEITRKEYEQTNIPLADEETCTNKQNSIYDNYPHNLQSLIERSWALFMRASRLEKQLRN